MKTKPKNAERIKKLLCFIVKTAITFVFTLVFAVFIIASDIAEHPELSDYETGTSAFSIALDIIRTIA